MKAAYIMQTGPAESIVVGELPTPEPKASQVLVRVRASAVNPIDTYIRSGAVAMPLTFPFVPGCDFAGEVAELGAGVTRFKVGDRVWGSNQGLLGRQGTLAEFAAIDQHWLYATPDEVQDNTAAAGALVGITAHLGLVREANLQAGETVFVNGGSGGVGSTVIQIAKAIGAKVIATAGSDERCQRCRDLGADVAINYKQKGKPEASASGGKSLSNQINVYWETTREPNFERIVALLAERGRAIIMAGRDAMPPFPVGPFYVKGCSLHGFAMFKATPEEQQAAADDINRWLVSGDYRPAIDRVMPLGEAAAAHRLQEENTIGGAGTLCGKIVIAI